MVDARLETEFNYLIRMTPTTLESTAKICEAIEKALHENPELAICLEGVIEDEE